MNLLFFSRFPPQQSPSRKCKWQEWFHISISGVQIFNIYNVARKSMSFLNACSSNTEASHMHPQPHGAEESRESAVLPIDWRSDGWIGRLGGSWLLRGIQCSQSGNQVRRAVGIVTSVLETRSERTSMTCEDAVHWAHYTVFSPQIVLLFLFDLEKRRAHACSSATKMDMHVQNGSRSIKWFEELSWISFLLTHMGFSWKMAPPVIWAGLRSSASWGYELSKEYHVLTLQSDEELITDALRSYSEGRSCLLRFCGLLQLLPGTSYMFILHRQGCRPQIETAHLKVFFFIYSRCFFLKTEDTTWLITGNIVLIVQHVEVNGYLCKWLPLNYLNASKDVKWYIHLYICSADIICLTFKFKCIFIFLHIYTYI